MARGKRRRGRGELLFGEKDILEAGGEQETKDDDEGEKKKDEGVDSGVEDSASRMRLASFGSSVNSKNRQDTLEKSKDHSNSTTTSSIMKENTKEEDSVLVAAASSANPSTTRALEDLVSGLEATIAESERRCHQRRRGNSKDSPDPPSPGRSSYGSWMLFFSLLLILLAPPPCV